MWPLPEVRLRRDGTNIEVARSDAAFSTLILRGVADEATGMLVSTQFVSTIIIRLLQLATRMAPAWT